MGLDKMLALRERKVVDAAIAYVEKGTKYLSAQQQWELLKLQVTRLKEVRETIRKRDE